MFDRVMAMPKINIVAALLTLVLLAVLALSSINFAGDEPEACSGTCYRYLPQIGPAYGARDFSFSAPDPYEKPPPPSR